MGGYMYHALAPGWWTGAEHQRAIDYVNTRTPHGDCRMNTAP